MTQLPNLGAHSNGAHIVESQAAKEVTSNELDDLLDNSVNRSLTVSLADANQPHLLATDDFLGHGLFVLTGTGPDLTADFTLVVGAEQRRFAVWNQTAFAATIEAGGSPTAGVAVEAGTAAILHGLGDGLVASGSSAAVYDIAFFIAGVPAFDAVGGLFVAPRALTIPAGAPGSQAYADTPSSSGEPDRVFDVRRNGSAVGTITFAALANAGSFALASDLVLAAGDRLALVNPANPSPDEQATDMANVAVSFKATA